MIGLSNGSRCVRHNVNVDNLGVMGSSKDEVTRVLGEVTSIFEKVGLAVHGLEMSGGEKALGVICGALSHLTNERKGERRDVGLAAALVRRPVLSVFRCENWFILVERGKQVVLWPSVVEELQVFRGLMPFHSSDWWLRWNLLVSASDASTVVTGCRPRCGRRRMFVRLD